MFLQSYKGKTIYRTNRLKRHTMEHKYTNRLAKEKSPYLQQHQHNPVDWYPWGEAAFEKAKAEDKPIFLSVGYATCQYVYFKKHHII